MMQSPIEVARGRMGKYYQFIGLLCMTSHVLCFNLEPRYVQLFTYPYTNTQGRDSYFGFSVALQHIEEDNTNWLIVGAPLANSTYHNEAEIPEPGALFKCSLTQSTCQEMLVDPTGNDRNGRGRFRYKDLKNYGWLGGSLDSQPSYQSHRQATCVCAPQWKDQASNTNYMNGACYIGLDPISQNINFRKELPLVDRNEQMDGNYTVNAYGQAGFSVHFPGDPTRLIIGAPGVANWRGFVLLFEDERDTDGPNSRRKRDATSHEAMFSPTVVQSTKTIHNNSLLGYSVTSGKFLQQDKIHFAAGAPQAANSFGKVIIFEFRHYKESEFLIKKEFKGEQIGEYFGGAITAADVNGDGLDDLIVGSPMYTNDNTELNDVGRIYTFMSKKGSGLSVDPRKHYGRSISLARFGTSLASLGDLNYDTFEDIAVGAPWEDTGKVYIFMGSQNGLKEQWSQSLSKEDFTHPSLNGFGMSISRGIDIDNNGYPDVAIGSFLSGHAFVVKSRPVARLSGTVTLTPHSIPWDEEANVDLKTCIQYTGYKLPQSLSVQAILILDYGSRVIQAVFSDKNNTHSFNENLNIDKQTCRNHQVTIKKEKIHPDNRIIMRLEYAIKENQDLELIKRPMTDPAANNFSDGYVIIAKKCKERKCQVDLKTKATFIDANNNNYVVRGKVNRLHLEVSNTGEPAYFPNMTVTAQPPLTLKLLTLDNCMIANDEHTVVTCNLSNPILKNHSPDVVDVGVEVNEQQLMNDTSQVKLHVNIDGEGEEVKPADNVLNMTLQLATQANITLRGSSEMEQLLYELTEEETRILNKNARFNHTYVVIKNGPTNLESIKLVINIPVSFSDGTELIKVYSFRSKFSNRVNCHLYGAKLSEDTKMSMSDESVTNSNRNTQSSSHTHGGMNDMDDYYFNCSSNFIKCAQLHCHFPNWTLNTQSAKVSVQLGINLHILEKHISILDGAVFSSKAIATIQSLNPLWKFIGKNMTTEKTVTHIKPGNLQSKGIPWWAIVLALLGSLLLLGLVTYALYKKGFFKREKMEEMRYEKARLERAPAGGLSNTSVIQD